MLHNPGTVEPGLGGSSCATPTYLRRADRDLEPWRASLRPEVVIMSTPIGRQAVVVGALLIYIRYLLHFSLLEEAAHMGFAETVCPNCHMHIVASGFCPNCGMALSAAPTSVRRGRRPRTEHAAAKKT